MTTPENPPLPDDLPLDEAVALVVADRRAGDPALGLGEALHDALDATDPAELAALVAESTDDADAAYARLCRAYRVVHARLDRAPERAELIELVRVLTLDVFVRLSAQQELWIHRAHHHGLG